MPKPTAEREPRILKMLTQKENNAECAMPISALVWLCEVCGRLSLGILFVLHTSVEILRRTWPFLLSLFHCLSPPLSLTPSLITHSSVPLCSVPSLFFVFFFPSHFPFFSLCSFDGLSGLRARPQSPQTLLSWSAEQWGSEGSAACGPPVATAPSLPPSLHLPPSTSHFMRTH